MPRSLDDALTALAEDNEFLTKDEVFPETFPNAWITAKRSAEAAEVAGRPHPYEYHLYLDA